MISRTEGCASWPSNASLTKTLELLSSAYRIGPKVNRLAQSVHFLLHNSERTIHKHLKQIGALKIFFDE